MLGCALSFPRAEIDSFTERVIAHLREDIAEQRDFAARIRAADTDEEAWRLYVQSLAPKDTPFSRALHEEYHDGE